MKTTITHPRFHRLFEFRFFPMAVDEWICDFCNAEMDPNKPIQQVDDYALCPECMANLRKSDPKMDPFVDCPCPGCAGGRARNN